MGELILEICKGFYGVEVVVAIGLWLLSVIGGIGSHSLDSHTEIGATEIDSPEINTHLEVTADSDGLQIGEFLGVGKIPFTVVLSLLVFTQGVLGLALTQESFWKAILSIPSLWASVGSILLSTTGAFISTSFIAKWISPLFKDYGKAKSARELIGKYVVVSTSTVNATFGQGALKGEDGDEITLNIRTFEEGISYTYGQKLLIIDFIEEKNMYIVELEM